jgi:hypothetical protein
MMDLFDGLLVDQLPDDRAGLETGGDFHRSGALGEPLPFPPRTRGRVGRADVVR